MGDERPAPGTAVLQAIFSSADQRSGMPVSRLNPSPRGPRQPGQSSPCDGAAARETNSSAKIEHAFLLVRPLIMMARSSEYRSLPEAEGSE
jgi:hypothetical protein